MIFRILSLHTVGSQVGSNSRILLTTFFIFYQSKCAQYLSMSSLRNVLYNYRVRIKRIAIAKCDPFFNYRDANVANSTKFAIPKFWT